MAASLSLLMKFLRFHSVGKKPGRTAFTRTPFFGMVGSVVELPSQLTQLESETDVRIAKVKFENGKIEIIPRANLEMILS